MRITPLEPQDEWIPKTSSYVAAHQYIRHIRGIPETCIGCGSSPTEWANITGNYHDPYDYLSLCRSCHRSFDRTETCRKGHALPKEGRCPTCRNASRRAAHHRGMKDPEWAERKRAITREAMRRYRSKKKEGAK